MVNQFEYNPLNDSKEAQQLSSILTQAFVSPSNTEDNYIQRIGVENFRVIRQSGKLLGGLAMIPMGQWFGRRRVAMVGIAGVGIAPDHRGSGGAIALMQQTLKELHANGVAISTLHPAVQSLYRKVGYEQGGSYCGWEIPASQIQIRESSLPIAPIPLNSERLSPLYQQQAQCNNGYLDRHPCLWQEILRPISQEALYAYQFGSVDHPQGYIIFKQTRTEAGSILQIRDWVVLTTAAGRSLWSFLAGHRSMIKQIHWCGSAIDALTLMLPEQTFQSQFVERWMLRIIDVQRALEARGYPLNIEADLHLDIQDNLLPENTGKFILSVFQGQGQITQGGRGELRLNIRGLGPLYTGLFSPHQLQLMGQLTGEEKALAIATQLFASPSPWMPDFF